VVGSFIFDYALVIEDCGGGEVVGRLDLTLVPRVRRGRATAHLCKPGRGALRDLRAYLPYSTPCSALTSRAAPFVLDAPGFEDLHPEEATWVEGRLDVTGPLMDEFVAAYLGEGYRLTKAQSRLRIGVAHSGGGKRAAANSFGECVR
jgi:hypothetical protein